MGDFSAHFHRPESGIHTVEGNVAGSRAAALTKKRQLEQEAFEAKKRQIEKDSKTSSIHAKFKGDSTLSQAEQTFRLRTVGLVTAEEFKRAALESTQPHEEEEEEEATHANTKPSKEDVEKRERQVRKKKKKLLKEKKKIMSTLSFVDHEEDEALVLERDDDDDDERCAMGKKTNFKDPTVDTSFLPDKLREQKQQEERLRLEREWKESQLKIRDQDLEIVYSYWDGSGHRRSCQVKKGNTIGEFLEQVRKSLCQEFRELQSTSTDGLVYVKEDLILPHDVTFYDLIALKARGKSGPLFHFDVHDDVRIGAIDVRIEKDEAHPGKVVERQWYDRNKHIFPASRWEIYDPSKDYGGYTIHGKEVNKKDK
jgi:protein FAM50